MKRLLALVLGAVTLALAGAGPALAHTKSETHSTWRLAGPAVHVTFSVPDVEARRLAGARRRHALGPEARRLPRKPRQGGGRQGELSRPGPRARHRRLHGFRRFEFAYQCPAAKDIRLHSDVFFDLVPSHVTFAQIVADDGRFAEELIDKDHRDLEASDATGGGKLENASFLDFVHMGMMHIFTGIDHMSFILGFIIIARKLRDLLFVITGFTIGHSLTLALAVTGIIRPHSEYIDALIGLTIALVGAENVSIASGRPATVALSVIGMLAAMAFIKIIGIGGLPVLLLVGAGLFTANYLMLSGHLRDAARIRLVVTLIFGLIHGFGFASNLLDERLPKGRLAELLVGFNVGVEIGQLGVVFVVLGSVYLLTRLRLNLPRPLVIDVVSAGLVAFGLMLFVARGFGVGII